MEAPRAAAPSVAGSVVVRVLTPFAAGYFLTYLLRAVNAVVAPDLVGELGLSAAELGLLTAAYLGAFALFQLPLGVLLDRYGPRRVQAALVSVAATGCALFAMGSDVLTLTLARGMIGLGFAGGLMSGFKAIVIWVPEPRRALANACVMSFGALGLLTATAPSELATQVIGWRMLFFALAAITLATALVILTVVPEREAEPATARGKRCASWLAFQDRAVIAMPRDRDYRRHHIATRLMGGARFRDVRGSTEWGRQVPVHTGGRFAGILWVERSPMVRTRGFSGSRDDGLPVCSSPLYRDRTRGARFRLYLVRLGMSGQVAILAFVAAIGRRGAIGSRQYRHELLTFAAFTSQYATGCHHPVPPGRGG